MKEDFTLILKNKNPKKYIGLEDNEKELRNLSKNANLFCPYCFNQMKYNNGLVRKIKYFSHLNICKYRYVCPETKEHKLGKEIFYNYLKSLVDIIKLEKTFKERIADIYFEYENKRYVIEIQRSKITKRNFKERTLFYTHNNIKVVWILLINKNENLTSSFISTKEFNSQKNNMFILYDTDIRLNKIYKKLFEDTLLSNSQINFPFKLIKKPNIEDFLKFFFKDKIENLNLKKKDFNEIKIINKRKTISQINYNYKIRKFEVS